jgi:hypothetical protein
VLQIVRTLRRVCVSSPNADADRGTIGNLTCKRKTHQVCLSWWSNSNLSLRSNSRRGASVSSSSLSLARRHHSPAPDARRTRNERRHKERIRRAVRPTPREVGMICRAVAVSQRNRLSSHRAIRPAAPVRQILLVRLRIQERTPRPSSYRPRSQQLQARRLQS